MAEQNTEIFERFARIFAQISEQIKTEHKEPEKPKEEVKYPPTLKDFILKTLDDIKAAGTYKKERVIVTPQSASIKVQNASENVINFCANNYLGLCDNPQVIQAAKDVMDTHGFGLSSVRFICGTMDIHKQLEKIIADFHKKNDAILYSSCFDANGGVFEALLGAEDAVISDELNHASLIDGIRLCKAERYKYKHMDMADLEEQLKAASKCRYKMIVTDGAFSMDGHIAPLKEICDLKEKYGAILLIDESHSTGFFGPTGRGVPEYFGVEDRVDIINSTLGKAMGGGTGGYTTGPQWAIDLLRQRSRPYLFSNALTPSIVAATMKAFQIIFSDTTLRDKLAANTARFREGMAKAGFNLGGAAAHPICPVMLGDAKLASEFAEEMLKKGIYVIGFSYPVVPKGKARIRVQISARHTFEQIDKAVAAFTEIAKQKGVLK